MDNPPPLPPEIGHKALARKAKPDYIDIYIPPVERVQALPELTTTRYNYVEVVSSQVDKVYS